MPTDPPQDGTERPSRGGSVLTRKLGPLQAWQWAALLGMGLGVAWYVKNRNAGAAASSSTDTAAGGGDITGDPGSLDGIPGATGARGPAGPAGPRGPAGKMPITKAIPKPGQKVGGRVAASDFPRTIYALSQQGRSLITFATVRNHRIQGKNVGRSGAPVYALVNTGYGPVWEQGFNLSKLPNGTKIATLPQFRSDIKGAA